MGWYAKVDMNTGEVSEDKVQAIATEGKDFWEDILVHPKFIEYVEKRYSMGSGLLQSIDAEAQNG